VSGPYAEVIGDPIAQSKSPVIHGFWLRALGLPGNYRRAHVTADGLFTYVADRRADPDWRGCNVTMPHKQAVIPLIDRLDRSAQRIGAVNTIVREDDGSLTGHNTDATGFLEPLRPFLRRQHLFRMARIIGTGGAARAIVSALADEGFTLVVAGRDTAKAEALLAELAPGEHHVAPLDQFTQPTDFAFDDRAGCLDLIVNATSLGMTGQPPLVFDFSHVPPGSIAYDIVTAPLETPFLAAARAEGLRTVDGLEMLVGQAAAAFRLFFGAEPPRERDAELRATLTA
jgi:shikimate dehydrogenase